MFYKAIKTKNLVCLKMMDIFKGKLNIEIIELLLQPVFQVPEANFVHAAWYLEIWGAVSVIKRT